MTSPPIGMLSREIRRSNDITFRYRSACEKKARASSDVISEHHLCGCSPKCAVQNSSVLSSSPLSHPSLHRSSFFGTRNTTSEGATRLDTFASSQMRTKFNRLQPRLHQKDLRSKEAKPQDSNINYRVSRGWKPKFSSLLRLFQSRAHHKSGARCPREDENH